MSRRPFNEKTADLQQQNAEMGLKRSTLGLQQETDTYKEWQANTLQRAEQNKLALDTAKQQLKAAGLTLNEAEIDLKAKKGAEKYNQWTNEWLQGESIETLTKKFNTDQDYSNNIHSTTGDEASGW